MSLYEDESDLRELGQSGSPEAFNRIASRYLNFVYGVARRQCGIDSHQAEDITQAVFVILGRRVNSVRAATLTNWLFTTTRQVAANARKIEARRRHHERRAAQLEAKMRTNSVTPPPSHDPAELSDHLTSALAAQREADRSIVLMRFVQGLEFTQIAQAMNLSDLAARKRLERAIDRLRECLVGRGITTETAALTAAIGGVAQTAPSSLVSAMSCATTPSTTVAGLIDATLGWVQVKLAASIALALTLSATVVTAVTMSADPPLPASRPQARIVQVAATSPALTNNTAPSSIAYTGVVSDPRGKPLAGVRVWSELIVANDSTQNVADEAHTVTDEAGRYTLPPLPAAYRFKFGQRARERILHFDDPRYAIAWTNVIGADSSVGDGDESQEYSLRLEPAAEILVKAIDEAGKPVVGAEVTARLQHEGRHTYPLVRGYGFLEVPDRPGMIKTDENGFARFTRVPGNARASVTITHPDHAKFAVRDGGVRPGDAEPLVATLKPGGRVRARMDLSGGQPIHTAGLLAVSVNKQPHHPGNYSRVTFDSDGVGTMSGVAPGTYDFQVQPDDEIPRNGVFKPARNITVRAGETTNAQFEFTPGTRVSGRLIDPRTKLPVADANVYARMGDEDESRTVSLGRVASAADGRFEFRALPGAVKLSITHFVEGEQQSITRSISVATEPLDIGDIEVVPPTQIRGRLVDGNGNPVVGRVVAGYRQVRTAEDGSFVIALLSEPPKSRDRKFFAFNGDQTLGVSLMYDEKWTDPALALPGAVLPTITLVPTATIIGQLVDDDGKPITNADIAVSLKLTSMWSVSYTNNTRAPWGPIAIDGNTFAVHHLPVGLNFDITANHNDKQAVVPLDDLQPGEVRDLGAIVPDLPTAPGAPQDSTATLTGRVLKEDGLPVAGATVYWRPVNGWTGRQTRDTTDHAGKFVLSDVPDGKEITVTVTLPGFDNARQQVVIGQDKDPIVHLHPTGADLIGQPAPELTIGEWLNGPELRLSDLRGRVVLLEINTIIHMMQRQYVRELFSTAEKYVGKDVAIVAVHRPITEHEPGERLSKQDILDYLKSHPMPFPIAMDSTDDPGAPQGRTIADYLIRNDNPIYVIIDKKGVVRAVPQRNEINAWIDKLLAEKGD